MKRGTPLEELRDFNRRAAARSPDRYARDFIKDLVRHAAPRLEQAKLDFRKTSEEGLSSALLAHLYSAYPGASREGQSGGHVDVIVKDTLLADVLIEGEAKAIGPKGFDWYRQGLTKLVGKYNSGRTELGLMLCYCRKKDMYVVLVDYKKKIKKGKVADFVGHTTLPATGLPAGLKGVFVTKHLASGNPVRIVHVWINMYAPTDDEVLGDGKKAKPKRAENKKKKIGRGR